MGSTNEKEVLRQGRKGKRERWKRAGRKRKKQK